MRILIVYPGVIPVKLYGGTQRVIWALGKELVKLGHEVHYLVKRGSHCDFASIIHLDENKPITEQITNDYDVAHLNVDPTDIESIKIPYVITIHGNSYTNKALNENTIFVSKNHASRYNSSSYVHNGLDWTDYSNPELTNNRTYFHFLGNAAWKVKNLSGAINVIKKTKAEKLKVLGGVRFNFNMGVRLSFSPKLSFYGMVGGEKKCSLLNGSRGLIFPVKWHEPFGLAIIESLYFGCPVFGTTYGSLPELVKDDLGYLSNNSDELSEAILNHETYSRRRCHEYARDEFNSKRMTLAYIKKYEKVISGEKLNSIPPTLVESQNKKWLDWK